MIGPLAGGSPEPFLEQGQFPVFILAIGISDILLPGAMPPLLDAPRGLPLTLYQFSSLLFIVVVFNQSR